MSYVYTILVKGKHCIRATLVEPLDSHYQAYDPTPDSEAVVVVSEENEINELSVYGVESLEIEMKDGRLLLSSKTEAFRLGLCDKCLVVNKPIPTFEVTFQSLKEAVKLQAMEREEFLVAYEEKRLCQERTYSEKYERESKAVSRAWAITGDALKLRFFNLNQRGATLNVQNLKSEAMQIDNSHCYVAAGSSFEIRGGVY